MVFVETPLFTQMVLALWSDEELAAFQQFLIAHPEAGDLLVGTGGVRKVRWKMPGRGKRGGARVIYFWAKARGQILLLLIYTKARQEDLSPSQKEAVRRVCEAWNAHDNSPDNTRAKGKNT